MLIFAISSILCGLLGRLGGWSKGNRLFRILGVPVVCMTLIALFGEKMPIWTYILTFGLLCASISTYWDFCPWNKGEDNLFQHGFFIGLSLVPIAYATGHWLGFACSVVLSTLWMGFWNKAGPMQISCFGKYYDNAEIEEFLRYSIVPLLLWLLIKL